MFKAVGELNLRRFFIQRMIMGLLMENEETTSANQPLVEMRAITKTFQNVIANNCVDLSVNRGEIHALLGENGAGKSTLMNVLYGLYAPDSGEIYLNGEKIIMKSPADAIAKGIGMIHQEFMLIPTLSVIENIILCMKSDNALKLDLQKAAKRLVDLSSRFGLDIDPWAKVSQLSVGEQQRVEILKALYRGTNILIMDEPTAVLTPKEVDDLFNVLKEIVKEGNSVIFISHKLGEVLNISDRITVLRNGKKITTVNSKDVSREQLAKMMVGREVFLQYDRPAVSVGKPVLKMSDVCCNNDRGLVALSNISLEVREGEIVGIAGVDGNGQMELAEVIHGLRKVTSGRIEINSVDTTNCSSKFAIEVGLSHIPENRQIRGLVLDFSVAENIALINCEKPPFTKNGIYFDPQNAVRVAEKLKNQYEIKCSNVNSPVKQLSGGNQQKVVLAREIYRQPKLLIAAQPTRGLDIGATEYVQKLLIEKRSENMGILLISSDLDEILAISDRILVIYEGKIMGEAIPGKTSVVDIGLLMAGSKVSEESRGKE